MLPLKKGVGSMIRFFKMFLISLIFICTFSFATSKLTIKVNNKIISSDVEPFIKNGTTYVPLRFVADALNVDSITWHAATKSVSIKDSGTTILLFINKNYAYVNTEYKTLENNALLSNDRTFVPIRFISETLGANVNWDKANYVVSISSKTSNPSTSKKPINYTSSSSSSATSTQASSQNTTPSNFSQNSSKNTSSESITNDSIYWLARIIEAEAGGEPFKGKVAVGEVILNRVESAEFPNTIWGVIFDKKFGIQFEPVANGTIYNIPSAESIKAAKTALNGSNYIGDCLYFLNPTIASSNWIVKNRDYYTTISNHDFYV